MSWAEFGLPDCEFTTPYTAMRGLWIALYNLTKTQYVLGLSSSPNGSIYTLQQVKAYMPNLIFSNKPAYSSSDTMWGTIEFDVALTALLAQFIDPDNSEIVGGPENAISQPSNMVISVYSQSTIETKLGGNYPGIGIIWANTKKFTPHLFALWAKQRIEILKLLKQSQSAVHATTLHKKTAYWTNEGVDFSQTFITDDQCQIGRDENYESDRYGRYSIDGNLMRHWAHTSEHPVSDIFSPVQFYSDYLQTATAYHGLCDISDAPKLHILRTWKLYNPAAIPSYYGTFDPFYTGVEEAMRHVQTSPIDWTGLTHQETPHSFKYDFYNYSYYFGFHASFQAIVDYTDLLHMEEGPSEADLDDGLGI